VVLIILDKWQMQRKKVCLAPKIICFIVEISVRIFQCIDIYWWAQSTGILSRMHSPRRVVLLYSSKETSCRVEKWKSHLQAEAHIVWEVVRSDARSVLLPFRKCSIWNLYFVEIVKFREMIEQRIERQDPPLTAIPDEHKPLIVKLAQERWTCNMMADVHCYWILYLVRRVSFRLRSISAPNFCHLSTRTLSLHAKTYQLLCLFLW